MSEANTSAVRAAVEEFLTAFDRLDWERFRRCFASDATVFFPWDLHPRRADGTTGMEVEFKRIFEAVRSRAAGPPYLILVPHDVTIRVWSTSITGTWLLTSNCWTIISVYPSPWPGSGESNSLISEPGCTSSNVHDSACSLGTGALMRLKS